VPKTDAMEKVSWAVIPFVYNRIPKAILETSGARRKKSPSVDDSALGPNTGTGTGNGVTGTSSKGANKAVSSGERRASAPTTEEEAAKAAPEAAAATVAAQHPGALSARVAGSSGRAPSPKSSSPAHRIAGMMGARSAKMMELFDKYEPEPE